MARCGCFEAFRAVSRNGWTVDVRSSADRSAPNLTALTCAVCNTTYIIRPTAVAVEDTQGTFALVPA